MENTILIGSLIMGLTSLLSLAGVLVRTGKLIGQVERVQTTTEHQEKKMDKMSEQLGEIKTSVKVLETKMQYNEE